MKWNELISIGYKLSDVVLCRYRSCFSHSDTVLADTHWLLVVVRVESLDESEVNEHTDDDDNDDKGDDDDDDDDDEEDCQDLSAYASYFSSIIISLAIQSLTGYHSNGL